MAAIVFICASTVGQYPFFYKNFEIINVGGVTKIVKEYGVLHFLNPLYLSLSILGCFGIIVRSYRKKRQVSYITSTILTISMSFSVILYFVERIFKFEVELLPFSFVLMQVSMLFLISRITRYDLWVISSSSLSESENFGFMIFNSKGKLYGVDNIAIKWFPELGNLSIDRFIEDKGTDLLDLIHSWINKKPEFGRAFYFERNDKILEVKLTLVKTKGNKAVYCLNIRDDTQQQRISRFMQEYSRKLEEKVTAKTSQLENVQNDIILSMASMVENRDENTGGHIKRTSDIVKIFVNHILASSRFPILTPNYADLIIKAAPLHDLGKIGVPDGILNKPGKFTPEEYDKMKTHSEKGAVIVSKILRNSTNIRFREIAENVAHYHHEKWDGNGYPEGLSGISIPFEARVMALADVFDALVSKRIYKESFSYDKAFSIIEESCGTHFDPELCKEFLKCRAELEKLFNSYTD